MLAKWQWDGIGPGMLSWFHIMWLIICIVACILFGIYAKNNKDSKTVDRTILIIDIILIISEILKQLTYHLDYYHYLRIDVLPYSFCSVPMYFALIGSLTKNEKIKDACYKFISFYGIVGGIGAMVYPASLETTLVYISIQTMLWHTILTVMAIYLIIAKGYGKSFKKEVIPSYIVLIICSLIAIGLNELTYHFYLEEKQKIQLSVDNDPGAYDYYKFGNYAKVDEKENLSLITIKNNKLTMTSDYEEALDVVIVYHNDNSSNLALQIIDENNNYKYLSIDNNKNLVITDEIHTFWEFEVYEDKKIFVTEIDSVDYFINNNLQVSSDKKFTNHLKFVDGYCEREGDYANFFFISNHAESNIPILNIVQKVAPYPVFVATYLIGFFAVSSLVFLCVFLIRRLTSNKAKNL